jgi:hypothetical protein
MPGIATQFAILEHTIERLSASADPALRDAAAVLQAHSAYAHLGAIGPALADFLPADPSPPGAPTFGVSPYASLWSLVFRLVGGDGTTADPGMLAVLQTFRGFIEKIVPIADAEDLGALKDLQDSGELDAVTDMAANLSTLVASIEPKVISIGAAIKTGMRPSVTVDPGDPVPNHAVWTAREQLFWRRPGRFAMSLVRRAEETADPRFHAYALGYLCSFAGNVAGNPFVNSIVGGPYRTQWWRNRWVSNYIDTWVHGYYGAGASMSGDTPSPDYASWPGLCNAKLHERITVDPLDPVAVLAGLRDGTPFPKVLPDDFAAFWMDAWHGAYGSAPSPRFQADALNGAYVMTWMMLWFQTSGDVLGCNAAPPMTPPGDCTDPTQPPWVDPNTATPGDNGTGSGPPSPTFEHDPDTAEVVSGIILALLGGAISLFGGVAVGVPLIALGVGMIVDGELQFTWGQLRCDLYWYRVYLYNGVKVLHDLTTYGGFTHPDPAELAYDDTTITLLNNQIPFDAGKRVVKSQIRRPGKDQRLGYPADPWSGLLGTWPNAPTASQGWEEPQTTAYLTAAYPSFFVDDDAANGLTADTDVRTGGTWPPGVRLTPGTDDPVQFANATANAVDLISRAGDPLPDWNLDGDRGTASLTFEFTGGVYTDPVAIQQEQP